MKLEQFDRNERDCSFTYCRTREGPNGWICYYKQAATMQVDPLEAWRTLGIARFTDTGKALKAWCLLMHEKYGDDSLFSILTYEPKEDKEDEVKQDDTFFDHSPEPNDNTKMVT